jgi:ABC-type lipoprotein export system ATPase subunit
MFDLLPDLSVLENLELPLLYAHVEVRRRRARQALERVGLTDHQNDRPADLLAAQRHQVLIARALINNPVLLLRDKPSYELDTESTAVAMGLLTELNNAGHTVVFCTAGKDQTAAHAHRILVLRAGQIVSDQPNTRIPAPAAEPVE